MLNQVSVHPHGCGRHCTHSGHLPAGDASHHHNRGNSRAIHTLGVFSNSPSLPDLQEGHLMRARPANSGSKCEQRRFESWEEAMGTVWHLRWNWTEFDRKKKRTLCKVSKRFSRSSKYSSHAAGSYCFSQEWLTVVHCHIISLPCKHIPVFQLKTLHGLY